jgi:hypothetical protein
VPAQARAACGAARAGRRLAWPVLAREEAPAERRVRDQAELILHRKLDAVVLDAYGL